jgi:hypothetical protein
MASEFHGSYDPWWGHEDSDASGLALSELRRIEGQESYRRECDKSFVRWYGDPSYNGFSTVGKQYPAPNIDDETQSTENVIREILTTLTNKFGKNKPVPTVITIGGTYQDQEEAQERESWVRGVFEEDHV